MKRFLRIIIDRTLVSTSLLVLALSGCAEDEEIDLDFRLIPQGDPEEEADDEGEPEDDDEEEEEPEPECPRPQGGSGSGGGGARGHVPDLPKMPGTPRPNQGGKLIPGSEC